jgi:hypothetical protein
MIALNPTFVPLPFARSACTEMEVRCHGFGRDRCRNTE